MLLQNRFRTFRPVEGLSQFPVVDLDVAMNLVSKLRNGYCQLDSNAVQKSAHSAFPSGCHCDLLPDLERTVSKMAIVCCSDFLTTNTKQIPDDTVNREEVLSLARGLEPPHLLLSTPDRFVRHLSTIVRPTPRIVIYTRHDLTMSCAIATELVGHKSIRPLALYLE